MANCEQHCDFVRSNVMRMLWIAASHEMRDAQQHIVRAETVGPTVRPLSGGGSVKQLPAAGAAEPAYIIAYTHARTHTEREKEREGGGEHTIAHVNVTWRAHLPPEHSLQTEGCCHYSFQTKKAHPMQPSVRRPSARRDATATSALSAATSTRPLHPRIAATASWSPQGCGATTPPAPLRNQASVHSAQ
jgi:hypothetical protein